MKDRDVLSRVSGGENVTAESPGILGFSSQENSPRR